MYYYGVVDGREFVRRARRYARKKGLKSYFDPRRGKGSHGTVYVGDRFTMVKHSDIGPGLLASMLRDLGVDRQEF